MNAADLAILNRRNRMTPQERDEDIVREMLGPLLSNVFPHLAPPVAPVDLFRLTFAELDAIAHDRTHPQRDEADELLLQWQADDCSRRTPSGGAA